MDQHLSPYITALQDAVHEASADYYRWSGGILYDFGVEALLQVYAARFLFARFGEVGRVKVQIESRCRDAGLNEGGRIDLTFASPTISLAIECKRYTAPGDIGRDLARLRRFAVSPTRVGLLIAPCYIKAHENDDWPPRHQKMHADQTPREIWHLSDARALPEAGHLEGWSHERALVIEV